MASFGSVIPVNEYPDFFKNTDKESIINKNQKTTNYLNSFEKDGPIYKILLMHEPDYIDELEDNKYDFTHNPFTMPKGGLKALEEMETGEILANQYDFVCDGLEMASGGERNYSPIILKKLNQNFYMK